MQCNRYINKFQVRCSEMLVLASYNTFTFKYIFLLLHSKNRCWFVNTPNLRDTSDYTGYKRKMGTDVRAGSKVLLSPYLCAFVGALQTARFTQKTKLETLTTAMDVFLHTYGLAGYFLFAVMRSQSSWTKSMVRGNRDDIHTRSEPSDS
jgi:hypothetical protein